jgi:hypothetical protein
MKLSETALAVLRATAQQEGRLVRRHPDALPVVDLIKRGIRPPMPWQYRLIHDRWLRLSNAGIMGDTSPESATPDEYQSYPPGDGRLADARGALI